MTSRSTTMPAMPAIAPPASTPSHSGAPALADSTHAYPPTIMNSPWARLMTFIMPNITASPRLISNIREIENTTR